MGFLVRDKQVERHAKIKGFIDRGEPEIAVLLAAADFEWTVRRAILALGTSPNSDIRARVLKNCSSPEGYGRAWIREVNKRFDTSLSEIVGDWGAFKNAYKLRHELIHGVVGTTGEEYAALKTEVILAASAAVAKFALEQKIDIFARLPVRKRNTASGLLQAED